MPSAHTAGLHRRAASDDTACSLYTFHFCPHSADSDQIPADIPRESDKRRVKFVAWTEHDVDRATPRDASRGDASPRDGCSSKRTSLRASISRLLASSKRSCAQCGSVLPTGVSRLISPKRGPQALDDRCTCSCSLVEQSPTRNDADGWRGLRRLFSTRNEGWMRLEWLCKKLAAPEHSPTVACVWYSPQLEAIMFALPAHSYNTRSVGWNAPGHATEGPCTGSPVATANPRCPVAFVCIRNVTFNDGQRLVSCCTNPACQSRTADVRDEDWGFFNDYGAQFLESDRPGGPDHSNLCECAQAILRLRGCHEDNFAASCLTNGAPKDATNIKVQMGDTEVLLLHTPGHHGDSSVRVEDWSVLNATSPGKQWACLTCPESKGDTCEHVAKTVPLVVGSLEGFDD